MCPYTTLGLQSPDMFRYRDFNFTPVFRYVATCPQSAKSKQLTTKCLPNGRIDLCPKGQVQPGSTKMRLLRSLGVGIVSELTSIGYPD